MPSHAFNVEIAEQLNSVELAILYNHFEHWIRINHLAGRNSHDGVTWMYQARREIADNFPYWNEDKVDRLVNKLIRLGWLRKGNYNRAKFDRTIWYALGENRQHRYNEWPQRAECIPQKCGIDEAKIRNPSGESAGPIPDTKPDTKPDKKEKVEKETDSGETPEPPAPPDKKPSRKKKLSKDKPGAVQRREAVHTTDTEHNKLFTEYGPKKLDAIYDKLNAAKLAKGTEYASDYHAILNWVANAVQNEQKGGYNATKSRAHANVAPQYQNQYDDLF